MNLKSLFVFVVLVFVVSYDIMNQTCKFDHDEFSGVSWTFILWEAHPSLMGSNLRGKVWW